MNFNSTKILPPTLSKMTLMICLLCLTIFSCKKKKVEPMPSSPSNLTNGMLVLNEGLFQQNNASLSFIDFNSLSVDNLFFENKTGRPLGDTGNDLQLYDGKIFVVMNVSSTLEILDAKTGSSIKQIQMVENGIPKQPRYITFSGSKAYISCYDGFVDVLDLNSLSITNRIPVGPNPEQLAVANNKLYVSNSGGLNFPDVDSTVSVISLSSETEMIKITVGKNPGAIVSDSEGDLYIVCRGNFGNIPSRMHRISSVTDTKIESFTFDAEQICLANNDLFISYKSGSTTKLLKFNTISETVSSNDFGNISSIQTFYGMQYSASKNKLYCFDAQGYVNTGFVHEYGMNGSFIQKFNVGLIPNHILIYD
jgi:hypothetical protein|tara:strand:- start:51260 stop:52354 length:1095 start_codon:yes stop_codon:yes gene_type:complete